jgi:hypothetical protein
VSSVSLSESASLYSQPSLSGEVTDISVNRRVICITFRERIAVFSATGRTSNSFKTLDFFIVSLFGGQYFLPVSVWILTFFFILSQNKLGENIV